LAAPVALAMAFLTLPAQAGTSVDIGIGERYPGYDPYPGYPPSYDDEEDYRDQISCREGIQIVRERNFRQVRPITCEGTTYRYRAIKRGRAFLIRVDSYSGEIVSVRPQRGY
jgi:hypothetical protein